jgi:hypothetical protein
MKFFNELDRDYLHHLNITYGPTNGERHFTPGPPISWRCDILFSRQVQELGWGLESGVRVRVKVKVIGLI